jgi:hypothetical protein
VLVPCLEETTIGAGAQEEAETTVMGSRSGAPGAVVWATTGGAVHSSRRPEASAAYEKPNGNEGIAERTLPAEAAWALTDDRWCRQRWREACKNDTARCSDRCTCSRPRPTPGFIKTIRHMLTSFVRGRVAMNF